ncbi:MAG TPA: DUF881 domain-containing protein [Mycobacteriales bacterium]|jgi:uncharacterized protein YlxW (UPF0749 family)|nr:DUF881 domain-containing protein [Mycobacteriales bacterium]
MTPQEPVRTSRGPLRRLLTPRARRVDVLVAALLALLGFGLAVQVRSTQGDALLTSARPQDLVQILDELNNRGERLRDEVDSLTATQQRLTSGSGSAASALADARRRTQVLGVLAGTLPASGPGIRVTIADPKGQVSASVLLDAMEELRNAGAEAMQVEGAGDAGTVAVRVVASTAFVDSTSGVVVDGVQLGSPYRFVVIGDPATLAGALVIPGGVDDTVRNQGGTIDVARAEQVRVSALHRLVAPRYARPQ